MVGTLTGRITSGSYGMPGGLLNGWVPPRFSLNPRIPSVKLYYYPMGGNAVVSMLEVVQYSG